MHRGPTVYQRGIRSNEAVSLDGEHIRQVGAMRCVHIVCLEHTAIELISPVHPTSDTSDWLSKPQDKIVLVKVFAKMATEMEVLEQSLAALGLSIPASYQETLQTTDALEICRTCLASILAKIANCSEEDASKSIQWPNNISNGDLAVILPKLRQGLKSNEMALYIMEKVLLFPNIQRISSE
jgi:hypothetical protein